MPDHEVNERWQRDHNQLTRVRNYVAALAAAAWPLSFVASYETLWANHGMWWQIACGALLIAALSTTAGAAVLTGIKIGDAPPLSGSNH